MSRETIVAAAIMVDDVVAFVPQPGRHHHVMHSLWHQGVKTPAGPDKQGFVTSAGRFVGREEARKIAEEAKQLIPRSGSGVPYVIQHPELFSEDVW
jgi:hypothetical protein